MSVSFSEYEKAVFRLEEALKQEKNEFMRDSVIQRFKFCIELAWKIARKMMGTTTTAPKQVIREMAQNKYIDEVELWLRAIDERNLSSYTYNEILAERVYQFVEQFLPHAKNLVEKFQSP